MTTNHVFFAIAVVVMTGCSAVSTTVSGWIHGTPPRTPLRQLTVATDLAANGGNATMLDIVFVYDPAAVAQLPKTGPVWFQQKDALQNLLATAIDVVALQVPAGSANFTVSLPKRSSDAIGVYVLANYVTPEGQPIANLTPWRQATIRLQPKTIQYSGN
jgi:type VI secretion system protein